MDTITQFNSDYLIFLLNQNVGESKELYREEINIVKEKEKKDIDPESFIELKNKIKEMTYLDGGGFIISVLTKKLMIEHNNDSDEVLQNFNKDQFIEDYNNYQQAFDEKRKNNNEYKYKLEDFSYFEVDPVSYESYYEALDKVNSGEFYRKI